MTPALPVGWRKIPLGDLVHISHGYAFKGEHLLSMASMPS